MNRIRVPQQAHRKARCHPLEHEPRCSRKLPPTSSARIAQERGEHQARKRALSREIEPACIRRGGELGRGKDVLLVKVSKPNQDFRFDVPVIGQHTLEACAAAGVSGIAIEAGKTLMLEQAAIARLCLLHKIGIHAVA